jgi:competence protein ComEA
MEDRMEPLVPDWRTLGDGSQATQSATTARQGAADRGVVVTTRLVAWVMGGLVAAALTGGAVFLALMPSGGGVVIESASTGSLASTGSTATTDLVPEGIDLVGAIGPLDDLVVDVEGAVARPGLVHVPAGGRVGDALVRAGGFAANADLTRTAAELNLAQQVTDGLKIVVPAIGQGPSGPQQTGPGSQPAVTDGPVDLNRATEAELDALPGVGPATIAKIVAARSDAPFTSAEDLRSRDIVGDAVFQKLRELVMVGR